MNSNRLTFIILTFLFCIYGAFTSEVLAQGNKNFSKWNRSYYKGKYGSSIMSPKKKCTSINRKRHKMPRKPLIANTKKVKQKKVAEGGYTASVTPKPAPVPKPEIKPKTVPPKSFAEKSIEEKREVEYEVMKKYQLPKPTSAEHEAVRKKVEKQLETIEQDKPIKLDPLYFTFDEDEFAFVDMEPFLVAAEYALQGRMLLIEGYTDDKGSDDYNVSLSMKRVQRIRTLMMEMGVPDDRISVVGYGEEKAKDNEDGQNDRRVDFTVF